jgi:hypothetical protein
MAFRYSASGQRLCARKSILLEWIAKHERGGLQSPNHESPD